MPAYFPNAGVKEHGLSITRDGAGGRFSESPSELMLSFGESVSFDSALAQFDIQGSKAHAQMLFKFFYGKGVAPRLCRTVYQDSVHSLLLISSKMSGAISTPVQFMILMIWALLFTSQTMPPSNRSTPPNVRPSASQAATAVCFSSALGV